MRLFSLHLLSCIECIYPLTEKETYLTLDSGYRKKSEREYRYEYPLKDIPYIIMPTKVCISSHDMYRKSAWEDNRRK